MLVNRLIDMPWMLFPFIRQSMTIRIFSDGVNKILTAYCINYLLYILCVATQKKGRKFLIIINRQS